jgi:O-antigen ligase
MQQHTRNPLSGIVIPLVGIIIGIVTVTSPYVFTTISQNGISFPMDSSHLLIVLLFLFIAGAVITLSWTARQVKAVDFTGSFVFLVPIFVLLFLSGFNIRIIPQILLVYTATFIILAYRGKISEIVIAPFIWVVIIHLIFCNISLLGPTSIGPFLAYSTLLQINIKVVLVFLVLNSLKTGPDLNRFLWISIYLCIITSVVALGQVAVYFLTGINYSLAAPAINRVFSTPLGQYPRVTAFFNHPNVMGTNISPLFMIFLYCLITPGMFLRRYRNIVLFTTLLMLIPLFFSCSRGTWVAMAFGLLTIFILKRPELIFQKVVLFASAILILWITGVFDYAYQTLVTINPHSVSARYGLFSLGFLAMKSHALIGYGWANFDSFSGNFWGLAIHSFPAQVFTETGALGFITYMAMLGYIFWRVLSQLLKTRQDNNRIILEAYMVAFITLIINNLFHQVAWSNFTFLLLTLGEAITRIVKSKEETGSEIALLMRV